MSRIRELPQPTRAAPASGENDRLAQLLVQIVDAGLAGCIFVVPMLLGGRHPLGPLTLAVLAVTAALAWAARQSLRRRGTWRRSSAEWLLFGGVVLLIVQLVPLPQPVLERLAPHTSEILPLWGPDVDSSARLGTWSRISLTPAATQAALVVFVAYALLFLVTVQRIQKLEDVERLLRWCALSALIMAAFAIVQLVTSNGKFFWVYEHLYSNTYHVARGAFPNRNHLAHFLALGVGPLIWWVQEDLRGRRSHPTHQFSRSASRSQAGQWGTGFRVVALGILLFAVLLSLSRGGALVTLLAVAICLTVCYRASSMGPKFVLSIGAVTLLIGVSLAIFGHDRVSDRLESLTAGSLEALDRAHARRTIWSTVAKAIPDYPLLGSGAGSHREVYPMYLEWINSRKYFSHAECGYLQVMLESGAAGLVLLISGIGLCGFWCLSGLRNATSKRMLVCVGAVSASLAVSAVHSAVDFVWYVPGCMVLVAILAACAGRLRQLATDPSTGHARRIVFPRHVGLLGMAVLVVVGAWMVTSRVGPVLAQSHWERFLILNRDSDAPFLLGISQLEAPETDHAYRSSLVATEKAIAELNQAVRWDPVHARAHLRLAETYVRWFHQKQAASANVMSVNQIRDAVFDSRSESVPPDRRLDSRQRLEQWLSAAIGDHYRYLDLALAHTRRALALCPLLGEGYLLLGELCFLEGGRESAKSAYVAQALKVRPFDGTVLLHAGSEAILNGDHDQGLAYWQEAFRRGPVYQEQIIHWLVGRVHPWDLQEEIRFFLETFQPDLQGLRLLDRRYQQIAQPEQMGALWRAYVQAIETKAGSSDGQEAAELWLDAMLVYRKLNLPEPRLRCGRNALRYDPNSFRVRQRLAWCLADLEQFAEAKKHLDWCRKRRPEDEALTKKMREIARKETFQKSRPMASHPERDARRTAGPYPGSLGTTRQAGHLQPAPPTTQQSIQRF